MAEPAHRRYQILGLVGRGGYGEVYRARLEGPSGFSKEVAVKLLSAQLTDESIIQRFRDEARILGLVRDRAIVGVEPPTMIGGRWAVVMEYIEGLSIAQLLRKRKFRPGVALEIVAELARALDKVYNQPGPRGEPLQVLHRDIKPGNIQITPSGEVKLLDFGIARAQFEAREAKTTVHIGGTPGFIAPERLYGEERPEGDTYSLGVVLHLMLTGRMPPPPGRKKPAPAEEDVQAATEIVTDFVGHMAATDVSAAMRHGDPDQRPSHREVERMCREALKKCTGESLRDWAERHVTAGEGLPPDELVGAELFDTVDTMNGIERVSTGNISVGGPTPTATLSPMGRNKASLAAAGVLVVVLGFGLLGIAGASWFFFNH